MSDKSDTPGVNWKAGQRPLRSYQPMSGVYLTGGAAASNSVFRSLDRLDPK